MDLGAGLMAFDQVKNMFQGPFWGRESQILVVLELTMEKPEELTMEKLNSKELTMEEPKVSV